MKNLKNIQEFSRTPEKIQGQQHVFQESRTKRVLMQIRSQSLALKDVWQPYANVTHQSITESFLSILYHRRR